MGTNRYIDDHTTLFVQDGDTAYASDVNNVAIITNTACDRIQAEMDTYLVDALVFATSANESSTSAYNSSVSAYDSSVSAADSRDIAVSASISAADSRDNASAYSVSAYDSSVSAADSRDIATSAATSAANTLSSYLHLSGGNTVSGTGILFSLPSASEENGALTLNDRAILNSSYTGGSPLIALSGGAVTLYSSGASGAVFVTSTQTNVRTQADETPRGITLLRDFTDCASWFVTTGGSTTISAVDSGLLGTNTAYLQAGSASIFLDVDGRINSNSYNSFSGASGAIFDSPNDGVNRGIELSRNGLKRALISSNINGLQLSGMGINFYLSTRSYFMTSTYFAPSSSGAQSLGTSSSPWSAVYAVNGTIQSSDENLKIIVPFNDASWLYDVEPIAYRWIGADASEIHYGFKAQEVHEKNPNKGNGLVQKHLKQGGNPNNPNDTEWYMCYTEMIAPMLKLIQEQKAMIDSLTARVEALEGGI